MGFSVVVYKFGKEIGDYYDSNEMLIAIWCRLNDPDLGQANLKINASHPDAIKAYTFNSYGEISFHILGKF